VIPLGKDIFSPRIERLEGITHFRPLMFHWQYAYPPPRSEASAIGRGASPRDVNDEEWALVAPSLTLRTPDAPSVAQPARGLQGVALARPGGRLAEAAPCHHASAPDIYQTRYATGINTDLRVVIFYAWGLFVVRDTEGLRGFLACSWLLLLRGEVSVAKKASGVFPSAR
jgi:hypothetical protein